MRKVIESVLKHFVRIKIIRVASYVTIVSERDAFRQQVRQMKEIIRCLEIRVKACQDLHYPRTVSSVTIQAPRPELIGGEL